MPLEVALRGLRVLDFSRVFAGPYCTMALADLGAEVLKIERPGSGDDTRAWGPPFAGGESAYYLCMNRNKASLVLDLASDAGAARARELAAHADVVVENFRVGWMASRGLDYGTLRETNPGLVYCSISACGQDGPDAELPGYDYLTQGRAGLMAITGEADGPPLKIGVAVSDMIAGLNAVSGILAALLARERTGEGAYLDVSLLDCSVAALANVGQNFLLTGRRPPRYGNVHPNIVPYAVFEASDGPFILAVGNDGHWRRCCEVIGQPNFAEDGHFRTNPDRVRHRDAVMALLGEAFRREPRAHWLASFRAAHVPAGPVQQVDEVFDDAQVLARGMVQAVPHPTIPDLRLVAHPLLRESTPVAPPPRLGEGGEELAERWLRE